MGDLLHLVFALQQILRMLHPADVEKFRKGEIGIIAEQLADIILADVQVGSDILQTELANRMIIQDVI